MSKKLFMGMLLFSAGLIPVSLPISIHHFSRLL
jgi:hypothetical protein